MERMRGAMLRLGMMSVWSLMAKVNELVHGTSLCVLLHPGKCGFQPRSETGPGRVAGRQGNDRFWESFHRAAFLGRGGQPARLRPPEKKLRSGSWLRSSGEVPESAPLCRLSLGLLVWNAGSQCIKDSGKGGCRRSHGFHRSGLQGRAAFGVSRCQTGKDWLIQKCQ